MEINNYFETIKQLVKKQDWAQLDSLNRDINQSLINDGNTIGILEFHKELLAFSMTPEEYNKIEIKDASVFENSLSQIFFELKNKIDTMKTLKAVYLEYFYDGGDCCTANVFLCDEYTDEDDYWGAEFVENGMIDGPSIFEYFSNGCDFEMSPVKDTIMYGYIDAVLLVSTLNTWKKAGISGYPLAFAMHDNRMVRLDKR